MNLNFKEQFRLPISERISQPSSEEVRSTRLAAGLTQSQAAMLVSPAQGKTAYRTWQHYEVKEGLPDHRAIPLATWELFLLLIDQHPCWTLVRKPPAAKESGV